MNMQVTNRAIQESSSILEALKLMDSSKTKMLFVFEYHHYVKVK